MKELEECYVRHTKLWLLLTLVPSSVILFGSVCVHSKHLPLFLLLWCVHTCILSCEYGYSKRCVSVCVCK